MCFRPADTSIGASTTTKCPSCGKTIQAMGGSVLTRCPFCKNRLEVVLAPSSPRPSAMGTPGSPKTPAE